MLKYFPVLQSLLGLTIQAARLSLALLIIAPVSAISNDSRALTKAPVIDSVEIITGNVFDLSGPDNGNFLYRLANKTHVVTRTSVIRRELLLGQGDIFDTALVNESIRNLRQIDFLLEAEIDLKKGDDGESIMVVRTTDKWTTTGGLSYHHGGGKNDLQIGIKEANLLGYGIFMAHDFFVLEDDRNFYQGEVRDNHFLGNNLSVGIKYSDNPKLGQLTLKVERPFYNLAQKLGVAFGYSKTNRRVDYYRQVLTARDRFRGYDVYMAGQYRVGPRHIKYYFRLQYNYKEARADQRIYYSESGMSPEEIDLALNLPETAIDSIIHNFQISTQVHQVRYASYKRLSRFYKPEDVNLGYNAVVVFGIANEPGFRRLHYYYMQLESRYTMGIKSLLLSVNVLTSQWVKDDFVIRRRLSLNFKGYSRYHSNHTFVAGVKYLSDRLDNGADLLFLDEDHGLRGFPAFAFSGGNRIIINLENRYFSDIEILSVGLGGVIFTDIGNIWSRGEKLSIDNTRTTVGAGLRFGISRSSQAEVIRIDFGYAPEKPGWRITFGTRQFF